MPETTIEPSNKERSELSEITSKYVDSLEEALSLSRPVVEKLKMRVRELEEGVSVPSERAIESVIHRVSIEHNIKYKNFIFVENLAQALHKLITGGKA